MKLFTLILLLSSLACAQEVLPDAPTPRAHYKLATWAFITTATFEVGADMFDQRTTQIGVKTGPCTEANVGAYGSRPTAARLYGQNLPIDAGLILGAWYLRHRHVPIIPYAILLTAGAKHLDGGIRWYTEGCL